MAERMSGGCACGRVRFTASVEPDEAYLCHCRMCQRSTGSVSIAFVNAKLDALSWIHTNALAHFGDEFRIQLAWMRQSPPDTPNIAWLFTKRVRQMKSLITAGIRSGEISIDGPSNETLARVVIGVSWIPEKSWVRLSRTRDFNPRNRWSVA